MTAEQTARLFARLVVDVERTSSALWLDVDGFNEVDGYVRVLVNGTQIWLRENEPRLPVVRHVISTALPVGTLDVHNVRTVLSALDMIHTLERALRKRAPDRNIYGLTTAVPVPAGAASVEGAWLGNIRGLAVCTGDDADAFLYVESHVLLFALPQDARVTTWKEIEDAHQEDRAVHRT